MKIVDHRLERFGAIRIYPFLPANNVMPPIMAGYISVGVESGEVFITASLNSPNQANRSYAEMMANAWTKLTEIAQALELDPNAEIQADLVIKPSEKDENSK